MFGELVSSIEKVFVETSGRRALYLAFLVSLAVGSLWAFDRSTGYSLGRRLDSRISALERLHALEKDGVRTSSTLSASYDAIARDLKLGSAGPTVSYDEARRLPDGIEIIARVFAATFFPIGFLLWGIIGFLRGDSSQLNMVGGALVFGLILGVPAALTPVVGSLRLTALMWFVIQVFAMLALTRMYGNRGTKAS